MAKESTHTAPDPMRDLLFESPGIPKSRPGPTPADESPGSRRGGA